jgi:hypothetical protein
LLILATPSVFAADTPALATHRLPAARQIHKLRSAAKRRDVRSLPGEVATLSTAVDGRTHRLDEIEKRLGIGTAAN